MGDLIDHIEGLQTPIGWEETVTAIGFSLIAAIICYLMYQLFYGSSHIGAGVHRTFILGGPAITMLFLAIQTSIPLSLGLLGALSFVRFRTPVKDPAEIGFLLRLVASSVGAATDNYLAVGLLYLIVFICLAIQWLTKNRFNLFGRGHLMVTVDQESYEGLEPKLKAYLSGKLGGLKLESVSIMDNRVSLHYQYRRGLSFDSSGFANELTQLDSQATIEVFLG